MHSNVIARQISATAKSQTIDAITTFLPAFALTGGDIKIAASIANAIAKNRGSYLRIESSSLKVNTSSEILNNALQMADTIAQTVIKGDVAIPMKLAVTALRTYVLLVL